jgi:hypothetical protein
VHFLDNGVSVGFVSVNSSGQASFTTTSLAVGPHFVVAYYQGDTSFAPSNSLGVHITVNEASTTLILTSSVNPSRIYQPVTFTAVITPRYGGQASGTVTFKDGTTTLGSPSVSGNIASLTTSTFVIGTHSITAIYSGDSNFRGSTSNTLLQVVRKDRTTTTLSSSSNPSISGKPVTFTAQVSSLAGIPTGKVEFLNGTTLLATVTLTSGSAKYTTSNLPPGSDSITAVYLGNADNSTSTSLPVVQVVLTPTITALASSPNPSVFGQEIIFAAAVASPTGTPPDGETVTFKLGSTILGTSTLRIGSANFSTSTLGVGTKRITVVYGGDENFAASTSNSVTQVVAKATSVTALTATPNPSRYKQPVTFRASVSPKFSGTPTGTVTFRDGSATLGTVTIGGGTASYTTSKLIKGTHNITATYHGSVDLSSSSASIQQTVD